jgi:hypothetical protein
MSLPDTQRRFEELKAAFNILTNAENVNAPGLAEVVAELWEMGQNDIELALPVLKILQFDTENAQLALEVGGNPLKHMENAMKFSAEVGGKVDAVNNLPPLSGDLALLLNLSYFSQGENSTWRKIVGALQQLRAAQDEEEGKGDGQLMRSIDYLRSKRKGLGQR